MLTRPRILLDVDGVLTHGFVETVCRMLREYEGFDNRDMAFPEHVDQWDIMRALKVPALLEEKVYDRMKEPGVAMTFEPIPGSQEFVAELNQWAEVYAVTSPMGGPHWAHDREDWLFKHYEMPRRRVASIRAKHIIYGHALVDDKLSHLVEFTEEWPRSMGILFRIPPNRHDKWPIEASNYTELRALLERLRK